MAGKNPGTPTIVWIKAPNIVQVSFAAEKARGKIYRGKQGKLIIPYISFLESQYLHHLPILGLFNTLMI